MKVLILSVTAGYGHHATAKAITQSLESNGIEVHNIDFFKYVSKALYDAIDKGYLLSTKYTPKPYGQIYSALERNRNTQRSIFKAAVTELTAKKFLAYLDELQPDVLVSTHIFSAMVMDELKSAGKLNKPCLGVVTDYTIHPFWEDVPALDYIVTASPLLTQKARKRGIPEEKLLPFGIPVQAKFQKSISKAEARVQLGLDPDRFTILYMSGSMGYGHMVKSVRRLDEMEEDYQMLAVCGRNERTYNKLSGMHLRKPVKLYGFVDEIDLMMDAADCIITKPGGLSTTECLLKRLPMILTDPIPGQEDRNSEFFTNTGAAIVCSKHFTVDEAVYLLLHHPSRREQLIEAAVSIALPNAATDLTRFIQTLAPGI